MSRLIVRNIPKQISESELKSNFMKFGMITDCRILFKEKKNRRIAFIGYKNESDGIKAKEYLNNTYLYMSRINVDFAKTADDPDLPRAWSKYTKGSSAYNEINGVPRKKIKKNEDNNKKEEIPQEKKDKFNEFLKLMRNDQNKGLSESFKDKEELKNKKPKPEKKKKSQIINDESGNRVTISDINTTDIKAGVSTKKVHIKFGDTNTQQSQTALSKEIKKVISENNPIDPLKPESKKNVPIDEKRLYVLNLPFNSNEEEIRSIFTKFGDVTELKLPKDKEGKFKGFAYVSYDKENEALRAFAELDNKIVMGRILHIRPSFVDENKLKKTEENTKALENEKSSYKRSKKKDMLEKVNDPSNWNSLFLNPNTVLGTISQQYNIKKREILEMEGENQAVRVALAETQIINETKEWLLSNDVNLDFMNESRETCKRSTTTLLIKNIAFGCTDQELKELFDFYGSILRFLVSPNRAIGIVEFANENFAQNCLKNLAYYKFKGEPLYLEWAPINILMGGNKDQNEQIEIEETEKDDNINDKILFIKNLNFTTNEEILKNHFLQKFKENDILSLKIVKKNNLSQGYGFIEFRTQEFALKALKQLQNSLLEDHSLKLSVSKKRPESKKNNLKRKREDLEASTKIVVRNIAFEATIKDLKELFQTYGEVKNIRMPRKMDKQHRGFGFIEFNSVEEAKNAMNSLKNTHLYGRKLNLEWAKEDDKLASS